MLDNLERKNEKFQIFRWITTWIDEIGAVVITFFFFGFEHAFWITLNHTSKWRKKNLHMKRRKKMNDKLMMNSLILSE